jgi:hypothetical protein
MARALLVPLCLAAGLAVISGCVVPVEPEWSDPDRNYPPTVASATPAVGTALGQKADGGGPAVEVAVVLADQNAGDKLYLRWIIDYPPWTSDSLVSHEVIKPGGEAVSRTPETFAAECAADRLSRSVSDHRLLLAVSDRPFLYSVEESSAGAPPDAVGGGFLVEAVWPFTLSCQ